MENIGGRLSRIEELLSIRNEDNKIEIDAEIYIILISKIGGNYGNDKRRSKRLVEKSQKNCDWCRCCTCDFNNRSTLRILC